MIPDHVINTISEGAQASLAITAKVAPDIAKTLKALVDALVAQGFSREEAITLAARYNVSGGRK